jgi:gamma-glutamylputrescine oxidase
MEAVYPQIRGARIDHAWGGTLAITVNRMPAFQRLDANIFSAAGYSGHGVAISTLAGKLMAEAVRGDAARFDVFAELPAPRFPGGAALRWPLLALAMTWYGLRDRL